MTRVYRYGLLPPTRGAEIVDEQLRLAHRYQNTLVEIERARREAVAQVMAAHDLTAPIEAEIAALVAALDAERAAVAASRAERRARTPISPERKARIAQIREGLRHARGRLKAARAQAREDAALREALACINTEAKSRAKQARATCGVYWGTYLLIEQAMDAARRSVTPPRFRRWTGEGAVGVQIQGGLTVEDLADDTRLQLDMTPQPIPGRQGKPRPRVRLRVGSAGRDPVWAEWPLIYHRPLPAESVIKWAKVVRRRIGGRDEWSLHLTISLPAEARTEVCGRGVVAVDLGWRQAHGTLRAGGWSDGTESGEILIHSRVRGALEKVADLRSIRDTALNGVRAALMEWRDAQETLAGELAERLRWLPQWRSPARFADLARWWRAHRVDGDEAIYAALEAWRIRDKHLWLYESHARRGAHARRRDAFRVLAAQLARRYDTLVVERLDLRAMAKIPAPESERESHPKARRQRFDTAPSELRQALVNAFLTRGGRVVTVPPQGSAEALLAAYRERSGVEELPGGPRASRFSRLRARGTDAGLSAASDATTARA